MDIQNGIVSRFGNSEGLLERLQQATGAARKASVPVIYVVVKFREGYPEISANNKGFSKFRSMGFSFSENDPVTDIHEAVAPEPGEVVVTKRRVGAFSGSDLDVVLRSQGIEHLVLTGIATSGVVLSTLRLAADLDYQITVLSDCCHDMDEEVHRVLLEKVFPLQSDVMSSQQWIENL